MFKFVFKCEFSGWTDIGLRQWPGHFDVSHVQLARNIFFIEVSMMPTHVTEAEDVVRQFKSLKDAGQLGWNHPAHESCLIKKLGLRNFGPEEIDL